VYAITCGFGPHQFVTDTVIWVMSQTNDSQRQREERRGQKSLQHRLAHRMFSRMHKVPPAYSIPIDTSSGGHSQQPMKASAVEYKP
jgi:hypothetical protein